MTSEEVPGPVRWGFLRPKGNISRRELSLLVLVALVPLAMVVVRIAALPGVMGPGLHLPGLGLVRSVGTALSQALSLADVPWVERGHVLYLLFLPTAAIMLSLARFTLGLKVLGFRSILIAAGFQATGIVPSLLLILVIVATIALIRPSLKRFRLPKAARVSVIVCIVVLTMVAALLISPWAQLQGLWRVAFFPVIVLGLLAEGISRTLDRDNALTASWRAASTVVLAFVISLVFPLQGVRVVLLQFPELLITQLVLLILIPECLDLRLLQDWDSKLAGMALPKLFASERTYRIATVVNRRGGGVIGWLGRPAPGKYAKRSNQPIVDALREGGHTVRVVEADMSLLPELRDFIPPHPTTGQPGGIVFNLAHGLQGEGRYTHVPAMLEMAGIAYAGPTPSAHALQRDRAVARVLLALAGVPVNGFCVMSSPRDTAKGLRFPVTVSARHESAWYGAVVAHDEKELATAVKRVRRRFRQEALVEEFQTGRTIHVVLVGNDPPICLPLVEIDSETRRDRVCPAPLAPVLAARIREAAMIAFGACYGRDFARIDVHVSEADEIRVLDIRSVGIFDRKGSLAVASAAAGLTYSQALCRLVDVARARYRDGDPAPLLQESRIQVSEDILDRRQLEILRQSRILALPSGEEAERRKRKRRRKASGETRSDG